MGMGYTLFAGGRVDTFVGVFEPRGFCHGGCVWVWKCLVGGGG